MSDSEQILPESTTIQSDSNLDDLIKVPQNHMDTSNDSSSTTSSNTSLSSSSSHSMELGVSPRKRQTARKHTSSQLIFTRENYYLSIMSETTSRSTKQTARKSTSPPLCRVITPTARKQVKKIDQKYQIQKQTARKLTSNSFRVGESSGPRIEIDTADDFEPSILNGNF